MRLRGRLWLCLSLAGCAASAGEASPASHDVIEVEVAAAPPPTPALAVASAEAPQPPVSALASAGAPSPHNPDFDGVLTGGALWRAPSAGPGMGSIGVGSAKPTARSGLADVKILATSGGKVDNGATVVAGMAAGFRRCYRRGLADSPQSAGRVQIVVKLGSSGEVLSASPKATGSLRGTVISCLSARVSSAQFAPPSKLPATLTIAVVLSPS